MSENRRVRALLAGVVLTSLVALFSIDYTVERGDTLGKIAKEYEVSVSDLVEANDISNPNLIRIGQVLVIPGQGADAEDIIHIVVRGDTLGKIALEYDTTVSSIVTANGISNPNLIRIGQELTVPGDGSSGSSTTQSSPSSDQTPAEPTEVTHVVQRGESLARIAAKYGTSISAIANANGIANANLIRPGQILVIPSGDGSSKPSYESNVRSGNHHIVERGEKLGDISAKTGVSVDEIARVNGITNGIVYVNTRLFLDGPSYLAKGVEGSDGSYTVKSGDRLGDIANKHGTTVTKIASANGLKDANVIRAGQNLIIPGAGSWVCPVENSRFFNDWGFPRSGGRYHEGNDLFTAYGEPVYAPVSGTVEQVTGSIGGYQVNLHGEDGIEYLGSHLSSFGKDGKVNAGDVIGYVGTSGNAAGTSPHLHFGMYMDGVAINPYPSLEANGCK